MIGTQNRVSVAESGSGSYSQIVKTGRHVLSADEPPSNGGQDMGPSPYEYVLAGLGACTAITIRMYAERHNWKLDRASVELWHEKVPAASGATTADRFHKIIRLEGDLTDEQRLRLFQIGERCPVTQTLRNAAVIDSELADELSPQSAS